MAQLINVRLSRVDAQPWGLRLQGGADFGTPLVVQKVSTHSQLFCIILFVFILFIFWSKILWMILDFFSLVCSVPLPLPSISLSYSLSLSLSLVFVLFNLIKCSLEQDYIRNIKRTT